MVNKYWVKKVRGQVFICGNNSYIPLIGQPEIIARGGRGCEQILYLVDGRGCINTNRGPS